MWVLLSLTLIGLKYFGVVPWTWEMVFVLASAPIWLPYAVALITRRPSRKSHRRSPARRH